jgi:antitoxin component of MazEF toxin-antitoxin module
MSHSSTLNTVIRTGNSLAVVVPANFVKKVGVKSGDKVKVTVNLHQGKITYEFINIRQLSLV